MMKMLVRDKIVCFKDFGISLLLPCYSSPDGSQHPLHTTSDAMPGGDGLGHVVISDGGGGRGRLIFLYKMYKVIKLGIL